MAALRGSSCLDFISLNIKEVVIGMDKCFSMEGMFSDLLVRHLNMIFRGRKEIAYINRVIALYSSHMKEKWIIHRGKENVIFMHFG